MKGLTGRQVIGLIALAALVTGICVLRMLVFRDPHDGLGFGWPMESVARFRYTALSNGIIVGAALAIAGVLLQALLRNPLAEPFILGLSSGAGLGVMIAMYLAHVWHQTIGAAGFTIPATLGTLAALALVYLLGQRRGWLDPVSLVLVGVIASTICGAGIMFFQHLVPTGLRGEFTTWLMGSIPEAIDRPLQIIAAIVTLCGLIIGMRLGRAMDAATLGDDEARSIGLNIGSLRLGMFVLAGILAAVTVVIAGPIGFVGLIGPHAARLVVGPRHGVLVVGAAMAGIALVVGSDVVRQAIDVGAGRMPIGIFTALIGGPAFIWLLLSGRGQT